MRRAARGAAAAVALLSLVSCSMLFPNIERAIKPQDTTLDELGIALIADVEHWIESVLFIWNLIVL